MNIRSVKYKQEYEKAKTIVEAYESSYKGIIHNYSGVEMDLLEERETLQMYLDREKQLGMGVYDNIIKITRNRIKNLLKEKHGLK